MRGLPFEILLVDEDADDRFFMDEAFKTIDYEAEVKKFITGKAMMQYLKQIEKYLYPSLIVLNDQLVGIGTKRIVTQLKTNAAYQSIPVIVYTGMVQPARKKELIAMGVFAYIEKGVSFNEIVDIARKLKHLAVSSKERLK